MSKTKITPNPNHVATTLGALVAAALDTPATATTPAILSAWSRLIARSWPVKLAYQMVKLGRQVRDELQDYDTQRVALIKDLGVETSDGGWSVTPGNWLVFQARMTELLAHPVTLAWTPIALADLGDVSISGADLAALDPLVVGEPASRPPV